MRYDEVEDPTIWLCRAEQYFEFQRVEEDEKVCLASYHMEGDTQVWIQQKKVLRPQMEWNKLKAVLMLRFGTTPYEDDFGELCKLSKTSTIGEYQSCFERLLGKAGVLMDKLETTCFISGL